jgi:tRNA (guanine10-N2)-dimethyltransferase
VVPNTEPALNSAQVLHNQLTNTLGWELIFIKNGTKTVVAQNIAEQDIDAYAARDQKRPKRDSKVGMLPPKLAQILINLGTGQIDPADPACGPGQNKGKTVLDPFCGTGVVMQEAALMGYDAYGTDLEQRMIDYSHANLDWLGEQFSHPPFTYWLDQADATSFQWEHPYDFIASEAYLGRPFSSAPNPDDLQEAVQNANTVIKKFLQNLAKQSKPGLRLAIAVPAWTTKTTALAPKSFKHLPVLENLTGLGYNRVSFTRVSDKDLIYHREGQFVARELLVLIRK